MNYKVKWLRLFVGIFPLFLGLFMLSHVQDTVFQNGFSDFRFQTEVLVPAIFSIFGFLWCVRSLFDREKQKEDGTNVPSLLSRITKTFGILAGVGVFLILIPIVYLLIILVGFGHGPVGG